MAFQSGSIATGGGPTLATEYNTLKSNVDSVVTLLEAKGQTVWEAAEEAEWNTGESLYTSTITDAVGVFSATNVVMVVGGAFLAPGDAFISAVNWTWWPSGSRFSKTVATSRELSVGVQRVGTVYSFRLREAKSVLPGSAPTTLKTEAAMLVTAYSTLSSTVVSSGEIATVGMYNRIKTATDSVSSAWRENGRRDTSIKVVTIGNWNMDSVASRSATHGIDFDSFVGARCNVINDSGTVLYPAPYRDYEGGYNGMGLNVYVEGGSVVAFWSNSGAYFNDAKFSVSSGTRAYFPIFYSDKTYKTVREISIGNEMRATDLNRMNGNMENAVELLDNGYTATVVALGSRAMSSGSFTVSIPGITFSKVRDFNVYYWDDDRVVLLDGYGEATSTPSYRYRLSGTTFIFDSAGGNWTSTYNGLTFTSTSIANRGYVYVLEEI